MTEPRGNLIPIYLVADESVSMKDHVDELNQGLTSLLDGLHAQTMAAAKVRFSILGFSDETICHLPLTDLRRIEQLPSFSVRGGTSYKSAFETLLNQIPDDVAALKRENYLVHRPAVFFLSDGQPTDQPEGSWRPALAAMKDESWKAHPNIIVFGIGEADPKTILEVATKEVFAYKAAKGTDTGVAIARFCETLTQSIISSGQALADGRSELQLEKPEGFTLAVDLI